MLDRGRAALLLLLASVLSVIASLGLPLSVTYWIARDVGSARALLRRIVRTVAFQLGAMLVVHAGVLVIVFHSAPLRVQISAAISLLGSAAFFIWTYELAVLQGNQQFRALNFCRMIFPPSYAIVLIVFLAIGLKSIVAVTIAWVGLCALSAIITGAVALRGLAPPHPESQAPSSREMSVFGFKGLLGSVTPLEAFQLDQAIVGLFISQAALGVYVVGVAFTNLPRFIGQSVGSVAYPAVAASASKGGSRRSIIQFTVMTIVLCGAVIGLTELALPFLVPKLFGHAFDGAIGVARILLLSAMLFALRRVLSECSRGIGRPLLGTVAELVSLACLVPAILLANVSTAKGVATALVFVAAAGLLTIVAGLLRPARGPSVPNEDAGPLPVPLEPTDAPVTGVE